MSTHHKSTTGFPAAPLPVPKAADPARTKIQGFAKLSDLADDWATSTGAAIKFYKLTGADELALVGAWEWESFFDGMRAFHDFLGPDLKTEHSPSLEGTDRYVIDFLLLADRGTEKTEMILHTAYVRDWAGATCRMAAHTG